MTKRSENVEHAAKVLYETLIERPHPLWDTVPQWDDLPDDLKRMIVDLVWGMRIEILLMAPLARTP